MKLTTEQAENLRGKIFDIVQAMDWERVMTCMNALGWTYSGVPVVMEDAKVVATRLCMDLVDQKHGEIDASSSGGFRASLYRSELAEPCIALVFIVAQIESEYL